MGTVLSYLSRKPAASPRIEAADPFIVSSTSDEEMAESKPRDTAKQQINEPLISKEEIRTLSTALHDMQEFLNRSGVMLDRQRKLESELETYHERLRRFTGDHARQNESHVENINSRNSPTALERYYEQFYDHERMDAVDAIESSRIQKPREKWAEIEDKYVACLMFEEAYQAAQALRKCSLQGISLILTSAPAIGAQYFEAVKKKSKDFQFSIKLDSLHLSSIDQTFENSLKVFMKETAENCDTDALVQRTFCALHKLQESGEFQQYNKDFFLKSKVKKYVEKCCKYAWKLVCQTPPYAIEGNWALKSGSLFNEAAHQLCKDLTSSARPSRYISWVMWPGLYDGSGRVIRKTEVMLLDE